MSFFLFLFFLEDEGRKRGGERESVGPNSVGVILEVYIPRP